MRVLRKIAGFSILILFVPIIFGCISSFFEPIPWKVTTNNFLNGFIAGAAVDLGVGFFLGTLYSAFRLLEN